MVGDGAPLYPSPSWPEAEWDGPMIAREDGILDAGSRRVVVARLPGGDWLRVAEGWIEADRVRSIVGTLEQAPLLLVRGLWLLSPESRSDPLLVTSYAQWNSWQWDPAGGALWYRHFEASPAHSGYAPVSRLVLDRGAVSREHSRLSGDLLAAPVGGAVLIRERSDRNAPTDNVHILDSGGEVHTIGEQCSGYFTDSYRPFGGDAAWSPDGQFVALRERTGDLCEAGGVTIYDRNGVVDRDMAVPNSPYRQAWYRTPNFADQLALDQVCHDRPPGVDLSDWRNRCGWSPDRRWFATMPGADASPHLGELLIYDAHGTLIRRFLIVGWPCNAFQWSPDSRWLVYGGPSGCA